MEFEDLLRFIDIEDMRLREYHGIANDKRTLMLAQAVKLVEEVGELSREILALNSLQRKEKLPGNLSDEFADVIITTLLLAKAAGIDIREALENKIEKINKRYERTE